MNSPAQAPVAPKPLATPAAPRTHFARNFIRQAVCELRFPTLLEIEGPKPPLAFAQAVRKEYPVYERLAGLNLQPGAIESSSAHAFRSSKRRWTLTLRSSAITLETEDYDSFDNFEARIAFVLEAAAKTIDSEFFTRVGLRYINVLPVDLRDMRELDQWVNPQLVAPLQQGIFGDAEASWHQVRGFTPLGGYLFQHGFNLEPRSQQRQYVLDYDFFSEDVPLDQAMRVLPQLKDSEFSMFMWSLGPRAREYLGPPVPLK